MNPGFGIIQVFCISLADLISNEFISITKFRLSKISRLWRHAFHLKNKPQVSISPELSLQEILFASCE